MNSSDLKKIIDQLHSISSKVNKITLALNSGLELNLDYLNDIRVLTAKIELTYKNNKKCTTDLE